MVLCVFVRSQTNTNIKNFLVIQGDIQTNKYNT